MAQGFSAKSRITVVFAGVSERNVSRETFLAHAKENVRRDGLFLRVHIANAVRNVQMAQRISAKVRITVVAVGFSDANVSREMVILVQENETRIAEAEPFDKVSGHSLMAMTEGLHSILPA